MTSCKYYDCGFCYAPDDVETSASPQSACFDPDYCLYLKSQMTEQLLKDKLLPDTIEIGGVKYQKVKEPEPKTLKELFEIYVEYGNWAQSKDVIAQELVNIVKKIIPKCVMSGDEDYDAGHNYAVKKMEEKLK